MLFVACNEKKEMVSVEFPLEIKTTAHNSYTIDAIPENNIISFEVNEPLDCLIESNQDWCVVKSEDSNSIKKVVLEISDNLSNTERVANVYISHPKIQKDFQIIVTQKGMLFGLEGLVEDLLPEGNVYELNITSDTPWTISSDCDWILFDVSSGGSTIGVNNIVKMTVNPNDIGIIRSAIVSLKNELGTKLEYKVFQTEPYITDKRVGDAGVVFDMSRIDSKYPQMNEWINVGMNGGIPNKEIIRNSVSQVFGPNNTLDEINKYLLDNKSKEVVVKLLDGEYNFTESLKLQSNQTLIGESKDGVKIYLSENGQLSMFNRKNSGIRDLTIIGKWSDSEPDPSLLEEVLPEKDGHRTIDMSASLHCYVDNVRIVNSACHPIWIFPGTSENIGGNYNTIRDVEIDGAYNKGGGCQGYFMVGGDHNLITGCKVIHLRHISMQGQASKYNVFYKNDLSQEISFHDNDGGDNLIENNRIVIPKTLVIYNAIMGPVSVQHKVGGLNFVYRNRCKEENNNNKTPWSDNRLYVGPWEIVVGNADNPKRHSNFRMIENYPDPIGHTLYPIILK